MKYAFMSFSCPGLGFDEMIGTAKKCGYDGIEPRIGQNHKHGIETDSSESYRKQCRKKSTESGIKICCIATSCHYADPQDNKQMVSDTLKAIDLASDLACPRIRVFGGQIPEKVSREEAVRLLTESMKAVSEHAAKKKVTVCMETHDAWCNPNDLAAVMKRVNHPQIGVNWDIMHPVIFAKVMMDDAFTTLKPWIRHVHFHDGVTKEDGKLVLVPVGKGQVDHRRAVQLLRSINYDGFLSGEWIDWEPYETHLPRELSTMKRYEQERGL